MATLKDIKSSITDLSPQQALDIILLSRQNRRTKPAPKATKPAKASNAEKLLAGMSKEQIARLLIELTGN